MKIYDLNMGFKQLRPLANNICVQSDFSNNGSNTRKSSTSEPNDVFEADDFIKQPKMPASIYTKSFTPTRYSHRHSIVTLLQPSTPTTITTANKSTDSSTLANGGGGGGTGKRVTFQGTKNNISTAARRNSDNFLLLVKQPPPAVFSSLSSCQNSSLSSSSSSPTSSASNSEEGRLSKSQSNLCVQGGKMLQNSGAMRKSRIPQKIRVPTPIPKKRVETSLGKVGESKPGTLTSTNNNNVSTQYSSIPNYNIKTKDSIKHKHLVDSQKIKQQAEQQSTSSRSNQLGFNMSNFNNTQRSVMSTSPDKTKILLISNPSITITTETIDEAGNTKNNLSRLEICSEKEAEEDGSSNCDLNKILGNFISATNIAPTTTTSGSSTQIMKSLSQESIVTEFGIIDTSKCIDFGIYDYLSENYLRNNKSRSSREQIEIDMSSDTDTSYLDASPPHRFSDSDYEQLEPLAITLETTLFSQATASNFERQGSGRSINKLFNRLPPRTTATQSSAIIIDEAGMELPKLKSNNYHTTAVNYKKPLRRNISLPATIFKLRLIGIGKTISNYDNPGLTSALFPQTRNNSSHNVRARFLSRLDSTSLTELENYDYSSSMGSSVSDFSILWSTKTNYPSVSDEGGGNSSAQEDQEFEEINEDNESVFSDIEKKALNLRNVKHTLHRQDTLGNLIAPPDFCNT